jgi:hypothetical protein
MNPMLNAIKSRRSGQEDVDQQSDAVPGGAEKLLQLIAQLTPEQKEQLQAMLDDGGGASAEQISKGAPSAMEKQKIALASAEENGEQDLEQEGQGDDVDSDDIAMGMLDSRFKNNAPSNPRNLHERVQTNMAKNLKSKGKI